VNSREGYGVELVGPTRADYHWQARQKTGFAAQYFQHDWDAQRATCPAGRVRAAPYGVIDIYHKGMYDAIIRNS
jgi:hypothetical protein